MKSKIHIALDFVIDKLTNSIQNITSGDSFQTEIGRFTLKDSKLITKKTGWNFNWKTELQNNKNEVYKLYIANNVNIIQGLLSISVKKEDNYIFMNLVENAPFNIGKNKVYAGVAGNLVAFACKLSFQYGLDGVVVFTAKTKLIKHYETSLGAIHLGSQRMFIDTKNAQILVEKYFKTE